MQKLPSDAQEWGEQWGRRSAHRMNQIYRHHLETQGRGGEPPPLSEATRHLYRQLGDPDGSGIRNHITIEYERSLHGFTAIFGIPEGRPSLVARVQDRGATIRVTQAMRGFLAVHGIFLRATTTHIQIPARHSWEKSLERAKRESKEELRRFWQEVWINADH